VVSPPTSFMSVVVVDLAHRCVEMTEMSLLVSVFYASQDGFRHNPVLERGI
jgi:hypothetical protein